MKTWIRACVMAAMLSMPLLSHAQDGTPSDTGDVGDRSTAFRAIEGRNTEKVPGGTLLVVAYGLVWLFTMGFLVRLGRLQSSTSAEVERLAKRLEASDASRKPS